MTPPRTCRILVTEHCLCQGGSDSASAMGCSQCARFLGRVPVATPRTQSRCERRPRCWLSSDGKVASALQGSRWITDWARRTPLTLAGNLILRGAHLQVPFDLGIAVPWTPHSQYADASVGILVRLIFEIDRE